MKKILSLILSLGFILTLSACDMNMGSTASGDKSDISLSSQQGFLPNNISSDVGSKLLTREEAINIALKHAGFKESEVANLTAELDSEMVRSEWEVDFDKDNFEYSYDINATTGEIIKNDKEID